MTWNLEDDEPKTRKGKFFGHNTGHTGSDAEEYAGPTGELPYSDGYAVVGTGGSVLSDPTNVNEYPLGREERPRPRLRQLPVRRKRAGKKEAERVEEALDLAPLQLLPPHIANSLTPTQESWLAARLLTYNDKQVCLNLGLSYHTFRGWLERVPEFKEAYTLVTRSLVELSLQLNGLLVAKSMLQLWTMLDHPSNAIRLKAIELIHKRQSAAELAAAKRETIVNQTNVNLNGSDAFEWARRQMERGFAGGGLPTGESESTRQLASGDGHIIEGERPVERAARLLDLLDSPDESPGSGEVLSYPGRE